MKQNLHLSGVLKQVHPCPAQPGEMFRAVLRRNDGSFVDICASGCSEVFCGVYVSFDAVWSDQDNAWVPVDRNVSLLIDLLPFQRCVKFLSSSAFKNIGTTYATRLLKKYGEDIYDIIVNEPWKLHDEKIPINGIGGLIRGVQSPIVSDHIAFQKQFPSADASLWFSLYGYAEDNRIPQSVLWRDLREDPYGLLGLIPDLKFNCLDEVALRHCDVSMDNPRRLGYIMGDAIARVAEEYNWTYIPWDWPDAVQLVYGRMWEKYGLPKNYTLACWRKDIEDGKFSQYARLVVLKYHPYIRALYDAKTYRDQERIVRTIYDGFRGASAVLSAVSRRAWSACLDRYIEEQKEKGEWYANAEQELAIRMVCSSPFSCLTGGPGRGKTWTVGQIYDCWNYVVVSGSQNDETDWDEEEEEAHVILLAPTGRAAFRLKEVTGSEDCGTVDRFLWRNRRSDSKSMLVSPGGDDSHTFVNMPSTLIIVDESSMLCYDKVAELLFYADQCTFLFVGDADQLPPLSLGPFFHQVLRAGIPCACLEKNLRTNASSMITLFDHISSGKYEDLTWIVGEASRFGTYPWTRGKVLSLPSVVYQLYGPSEGTVEQKLAWNQMYADLVLQIYLYFLNVEGLDVKDLMLLSPLRNAKKSDKHPEGNPASAEMLNCALRDMLNPKENTNGGVLKKEPGSVVSFYDMKGKEISGWKIGEYAVRIGDRVMCEKNHAQQAWAKYQDGTPDTALLESGYGIYNGDIGTIIRWYPRDGQRKAHLVVLLDDGRCVEVEKDLLHDFTFGYALSVHKAQGSEAKVVIYLLPWLIQKVPKDALKSETFYTKNLLYTGVTRAKERVVLVGSLQELVYCIAHPADPGFASLGDDLFFQLFGHIQPESVGSNIVLDKAVESHG